MLPELVATVVEPQRLTVAALVEVGLQTVGTEAFQVSKVVDGPMVLLAAPVVHVLGIQLVAMVDLVAVVAHVAAAVVVAVGTPAVAVLVANPIGVVAVAVEAT